MAESFSSLVDAFKNVGVSRAYGDPVQLGGEELIPVALVSFGFGGGSAPASDDAPAGSGGGGGGFVLPLGVYAGRRGGGVVFRPNPIAVLMGLAPVVCAIGLSLRGFTSRGVLRGKLHGR
ncbi:hypothetical protein AB4Y86_12695 [Arthrobacter sp. 2YAF22_2]|uniref:hypothetical protein n=1 Tax=Arthrobacter sp. 2YAF22_2 TaxID=3233029 RepID=UPI003F923CCD